MGVLNLFGGAKKTEKDIEAPPCPHTSLIQRWDSPEDMGKKELAQYVCTTCGETFSYEGAQHLLDQTLPPAEIEAEAERISNEQSKEEQPARR